MAKCTQCGKKAPWLMELCNSCMSENARKQDELELDSPLLGMRPTSISVPEAEMATTSPRVLAVSRRYREAYLVARTTVGFGNAIKTTAVILAIVVLVMAISIGSQTAIGRDNSVGFELAVVIGVFGVFGGTLLYLQGVLVSAQGQTLKASLDTAVNNSPFLTDEHRAQIMSLPAA